MTLNCLIRSKGLFTPLHFITVDFLLFYVDMKKVQQHVVNVAETNTPILDVET